MATTAPKGDDRSEKRRRPFGKATTVYETEICGADRETAAQKEGSEQGALPTPAASSLVADKGDTLQAHSATVTAVSCCVGIALGAWQPYCFSLLNILGTSCSRPQPASEAGAAGGGGPEAGTAGGGGSGDATGSTVSEDPAAAADVDDAPPEEGEGSAKKQKFTDSNKLKCR
ncbi:hypothetical protein Bbelb_071790 [Branchiostoma belcheri]|nr:hypothetical protein Bbelb_071790 [Branchiostoma belcheri]